MEEREGENEEGSEKVFVMLGKEVKEGKANLLWVLRNCLETNKRLVIAHVHKPASKINIMGAQFPVSQLAEEEVMAYRFLEREKMHKILNEYLDICSSQKIEADKIVIEREDTAKGIVDLILENGITELVIGAASDRQYSRRLRAPKSKKAIFVQQKADPSCKILFVCRGNLICIRESGEGRLSVPAMSASASPSPRSSVSDLQRSTEQSPSINATKSEHDIEWPMNGLDQKFRSMNEAGPSSVWKDSENEEDYQSSAGEDISIDDIDLYEQLKDALIEAEVLRNEAYEETRRRQQAERDLLDASQKAKLAENSYRNEVRQRKDAEENLMREKLEIERDEQQLGHILDKINEAREQRIALELKISDSESNLKGFESKLSEAYQLLQSLRLESSLNADRNKEGPSFSADLEAGEAKEFLYDELIQATDGFDESVKIGEGGHGSVFKGINININNNNNIVAIKMLNHDIFQGENDFTRKVARVSNLRHSNISTLIGQCTEARALIYEYASNGSLDDHIRGKNQVMTWQVNHIHGKNQVMTWQLRACIASEICTALTYLHSIQPSPIVHGNLKPSNVLLDSNYSVKLIDLHLGTTFVPNYNARRATLAFVEPEFLATGELVPACDIYSLGIILLILLTGRPAFRVKKSVHDALDKGSVHEVLDGSAGDWPLEETKELASFALRCCDMKRENRPSLEEVQRAVELVLNTAKSSKTRSWSFGSDSDSGRFVPSYFSCPILKEIMKDPQIAADGFTYEAKAIKEWVDSGHDTSPMTNLKLPNFELIPNHALRSAIQEWLQKCR